VDTASKAVLKNAFASAASQYLSLHDKILASCMATCSGVLTDDARTATQAQMTHTTELLQSSDNLHSLFD